MLFSYFNLRYINPSLVFMLLFSDDTNKQVGVSDKALAMR